MTDGEDFTPQLGRQRQRGKGDAGRPVLHRIIAATNFARGGPVTSGRRGFTGSRMGRGAGVGRVLSSRDRFAAYRNRRVMVKARNVRLKGRGLEGAKAHLRYIQRDGTTRDGERGGLYSAQEDRADRDAFLERGSKDRHQFRFIVSPEDGAEYDDLKPLTRRLMERVEQDLGTRLDWVAVDHFDTGHPHTHIVVRGKDDCGSDLVIAKDYICHGLRERACELVDIDLGPRDDHAVEQRLRAEVQQERFTSIDRSLLRDADASGLVRVHADVFQQTIRTGRLRQLERLGLASPDRGDWCLAPDLADTLRRMGERQDIIRTMQRAYSARGKPAPALFDQVIHETVERGGQTLFGKVVERGLADEFNDRHYLVVDATDGRGHYVPIGKGESVEPVAEGSIVRIVPKQAAVRTVDRTIVEVAAAQDGRYAVDLHLAHDRAATDEYAEAHVRRLEAMRRALGAIEREPDGTWLITADHLDKVMVYEQARLQEEPVRVEILSRRPLEQLVEVGGATWLDVELQGGSSHSLSANGFGGELIDALTRRRAWLVEQELAHEASECTVFRPDLIGTLRRRELLRIASQISADTGRDFVSTELGDRFEGIYKGSVDLISGRYALIERSREFTLVPWRPVLERQIGKPVSGLLRQTGVSWTIGRQRTGPSIS